jgi:hypothetical protein
MDIQEKKRDKIYIATRNIIHKFHKMLVTHFYYFKNNVWWNISYTSIYYGYWSITAYIHWCSIKVSQKLIYEGYTI